MQSKRTIVGLAQCFNHKVSHENGQKGVPMGKMAHSGRSSSLQLKSSPTSNSTHPPPRKFSEKIFYLPYLYLELRHTFPVTARVTAVL